MGNKGRGNWHALSDLTREFHQSESALVPDLRGQFIRTYAAGNGIDPGRAFGTPQTDSVTPEQWSEAPAFWKGRRVSRVKTASEVK